TRMALLLFCFVSSAFCISQLVSLLINDAFYLTIWTKTFSSVIAIIFSLYSFGSVIEKVLKTPSSLKITFLIICKQCMVWSRLFMLYRALGAIYLHGLSIR